MSAVLIVNIYWMYFKEQWWANTECLCKQLQLWSASGIVRC